MYTRFHPSRIGSKPSRRRIRLALYLLIFPNFRRKSTAAFGESENRSTILPYKLTASKGFPKLSICNGRLLRSTDLFFPEVAMAGLLFYMFCRFCPFRGKIGEPCKLLYLNHPVNTNGLIPDAHCLPTLAFFRLN